MVVKLRVPSGDVLVGIRYRTCQKGKMMLRALRLEGPVEEGVHQRIWWHVSSNGAPPRVFQTMNGPTSVQKLLNTYALLDADACMNIDDADFETVSEENETVRELASPSHVSAALSECVPDRARDGGLYGIPQRQADSGICWYAALMFVLCHNLDVRSHLESYVPRRAQELLRRCLHDPEASERLRELFWKEYGMGDPYGQAPELDGQNGLTQLYVLAGRIGMPILRYFVDAQGTAHKLTDPVTDPSGQTVPVSDVGTRGEPAQLLTFRFRRGAHEKDARVQPPRRKVVCGRRFRLVGMMIGSEHCGHQIAACAAGRSWRCWGICDSDAQHRGIGVTHWTATTPSRDRAAWWEQWKAVVPTVKFHGGYCNLSPQNAPVHAKSTDAAGMTNVDFVYMAECA